MDLANKLKGITPRIRNSAWTGHEHYRGYAGMVLPFSSGHMLALRVFPESDISPYKSVWHCTPEGEWSIYNDGPSLNTTCPRWWGPALKHAGLTGIELSWIGPNDLRVKMESPQLEWTMSMTAPPLLQALNKINASIPLWMWKKTPLMHLQEWMARRLGMGNLNFSFTTPSKKDATILLEQLFYIDSSEAVWKGRNLGQLQKKLNSNPTIGKVQLPTRPSFVIAQAFARINDIEEYRQTKSNLTSTSSR